MDIEGMLIFKGVNLGITKKCQYQVGINQKVNYVGREQSTIGSSDEYFSDWNQYLLYLGQHCTIYLLSK